MIGLCRKYGHCADLMVMFNCRSNIFVNRPVSRRCHSISTYIRWPQPSQNWLSIPAPFIAFFGRNNINDFGLKCCIFVEVGVMWITGSSPPFPWTGKTLSSLRMFQPITREEEGCKNEKRLRLAAFLHVIEMDMFCSFPSPSSGAVGPDSRK